MEDKKRDSDMEEWDWEVLIDNPPHKDDNIGISEEGQGSFTVSEGGDTSTNSLIRCDYFSLESDSHLNHHEQQQQQQQQAEYGSWMDPGQAEFPNRRTSSKPTRPDSHITAKRRRNSPSSASDDYGSSSSSGCSCGFGSANSSDDGQGNQHNHHLLELLQHSHSQCCPRQYDANFDQIGSHILESIPPLTHPESGDMEFDHPQPDRLQLCPLPQQEREQAQLHLATVDDPFPADEPQQEQGREAERNVESQAADGKEISPPPAWSWRRVPVEVFKYCMLRVTPVTVSVWSLSVAAAAVLGFVLVRRRWLSKMKNKMKRNSHSLHLNITVDDKKVSQFMSRAARLNEAFSVVKRVPVTRPSLPAPGVALWPMMNLR